MPEYTFQPARRPSLLARFVQDVSGFFADPLGFALQGAIDTRTRDTVPRLPLPVTVNTDAGTVAIQGSRVLPADAPNYMRNAPRYIATRPGQQYVAGRVQPLLQQALLTGTVPTGLPAGYRAVAGAIAGLSSETRTNMASAIIPPGGMASFIQQAAPNRIAMMRGGNLKSGGSRRVRRKKKAKAAKRRAGSKRKSSGRKMKFGSPAWQKKYKVGKYRK
jgi:hypothetical protein